MKEDLKTILYVGLGAISETSDSLKAATDSLYNKGKELYEKGVIKNEELKHNIGELMKEREECHCQSENKVDHLVDKLNGLSDDEKRKIMDKMGWADKKNDKGEGK